MKQGKKMNKDFLTYLTWSAHALMPVDPDGGDIFFEKNKLTIQRVAQKLLKTINYTPRPIYRGVLFKEPVSSIPPNKNWQHLSFSTDRSVAEHFADANGFSSEYMNVAARLGEYGYIIEYTPKISEVLFHYRFLSMLPYAEGYSRLDMDGPKEVASLKKQKEVIILQPAEPFTNITPKP